MPSPKPRSESPPPTPQTLQALQTLPQQYKPLYITNQRLHKQISILKLQLSEKDRIIHQLKIQIDSNILEDTKGRLQYLRMVQEEVQEKTREAMKQYLERVAVFEADFQRKAQMVFKLERDLEFQREQNRKLSCKIRELKQHIIIALVNQSLIEDEKDLIINELTKIINGQQMQSKIQKIKNDTVQKYLNPEPEPNPKPGRQSQPNPKNPSTKVHIKRNI